MAIVYRILNLRTFHSPTKKETYVHMQYLVNKALRHQLAAWAWVLDLPGRGGAL